MIKKMNFSYKKHVFHTDLERSTTMNWITFINVNIKFRNKANREAIRLAI